MHRWDTSKPEVLYTATKARTIASLRYVNWFRLSILIFRHYCITGRSVQLRQGTMNLPQLKIPIDHYVIDELHLFLRIFDVLMSNLISLALLMDRTARDGSKQHLEPLPSEAVA